MRTGLPVEDHQWGRAEPHSFFDDCAIPGNLIGALDAYAAAECVWENTGLPTATGIDEVKGLMQGFIDGYNLQAIIVELLGIAVSGDQVLTERIDHLDDESGNRIASLPVAGTLEVRGGKIVAWRDYFDPRPLLPEG